MFACAIESSGNTKFSYNQTTSHVIRASTKLSIPEAGEQSGAMFYIFILTHLIQPLNHVDIAITFHGYMITILFAVGVADFFHRESVSDVVG
jgi:hypothetical protein